MSPSSDGFSWEVLEGDTSRLLLSEDAGSSLGLASPRPVVESALSSGSDGALAKGFVDPDKTDGFNLNADLEA